MAIKINEKEEEGAKKNGNNPIQRFVDCYRKEICSSFWLSNNRIAAKKNRDRNNKICQAQSYPMSI